MTSDLNPDNRASRQKGFALIIVIWVGVLLALMAAAFSSAVRSRIKSTFAHAETVKAEALANAGVRIALLALLGSANSKHRFSFDGTALTCALDDQAIVVIQVEDEGGKINLNTANDAILVTLFTGLGATRADARKYADRILDFRDIDNDKRSDGAERDDYKKAGASAGPKNSNFASVDELDQVLGVPPDLRTKAKPYLTTLSDQNGVDPRVASKMLRSLLVRGSSEILAGVQPDAEGTSIFDNGDLPPQFVSNSPRNGYLIRAEAVLPSGARYVSEAIVEISAASGGAPLFRQWRRGQSSLQPGQTLPGAKLLPPC